MQISHNVVWPGRPQANDSWGEVRQIVDAMKLGETVKIVLDTEKEADSARKAAQRYATEILHCHDSGWRLASTKRKNTLYLLKRAS